MSTNTKRVSILYFSGTGNTLRVISKIQKNLSLSSIDCQLFPLSNSFLSNPQSIEDDLVYKIKSSQVIAFSYPIYGFNAPHMVNKIIKKLLKFPELKNKNFFIIKTSGEPYTFNNSSSSRIKRYIKKAKGNLFFEAHILMPYNILFRYKDYLAKQLDLASDKYCLYVAEKVKKAFQEGFREKEIIKPNLLSFLGSSVCRLVYLSPILGVCFFVSKKKCINCNKCIRNCPKSNIYRNRRGKIKFKFRCMYCMRCIQNCPTNAINMDLFNVWRVNGKYNFESFRKDDSLDKDFVNDKTKGYYRIFKKYFKKVDSLSEKLDIQNKK